MVAHLNFLLRRSIALLLLAVVGTVPVSAVDEWEAIHQEMREALAVVSQEYFGPAAEQRSRVQLRQQALAALAPWMIVVGFTGGMEGPDSTASGIVALQAHLEEHLDAETGVLTLTYNNFHWRRAAAKVMETVRARHSAGVPGMAQPLVVVHGHSWGAGSIGKFARLLRDDGLEISLAIYIDSFMWRNPRVPANVRNAVNFYQRAGLLNGLPMRGKSRLVPEDPERTRILGNYRIRPQTESWGWSWNLLQPLLYRQHHLIAHDERLRKYLLEIVNLKQSLLVQAREPVRTASENLFDRVVILGASVSAEEKAPSPGRLLARHMGTSEERILVIAEGGAVSDRHLSFLDNIDAFRPTLIVALDLFYHDFKLSLFLSDSRKTYVRDYLERLHRTGAVVVVGGIPPQVLLRHEHANRYLESLAAELPRLVLLDVGAWIGKLDAGKVRVHRNGREIQLTRGDVFADRVHPNELGTTLVANFILDQLRERFLNGLGAEPDLASLPLPLPAESRPQ